MLNISHVETCNYVNGPGKRFVIWVQGCKFHCKGCGNPDTWDFKKGNLISIDTLYNMILADKSLDGITLSGGEPFLQAQELYILAKKIKETTTLTIQVFSGYEWNEFENETQRQLLKYIDILIYGRFDSSKKDNNQKIWFNPNATKIWNFNNSDAEIDIDIDGNIFVSGFPKPDLLKILENINNERI